MQDAIAKRQLPWHMTFRKGYVAFKRSPKSNAVIVDVYWNKAPRLAVKLPVPPDELGLRSPYAMLADSWLPSEHEWGWTVPSADLIPDVGEAVEIARRFDATSGATAVPDPAAPPASGGNGDGATPDA